MKKSEAFSNHRVNMQLINKGWGIDKKGRNVLLNGECKTNEQKEKLNGLLPDYILYQSGSQRPLAVIEVKKPNVDLSAALRQGRKYARLLGVNIVFATDSYVVKTSTADGDGLTLDSVKIDDFVTEHLLLKLDTDPQLTTPGQVIKHRADLIKIFKKAEQLLRKNGIDVGMQCIYEFCIILFIKINSEIRKDGNWDALCSQTEDDVMDTYRDIIDEYKNRYEGIFRETNITDPEIMQKVIHSLKDINLTDTNIDVKGEAYEYFLKRYSKQNKSVLGQHFTPRHITDMMTLLLDPKVGEKTYDPFCGTGGMLISCYKWMRKNIKSTKDIRILNEQTLFGRDINYGTSQLAKMNMVIMEDGSSNIENIDSLNNPAGRKYDKVITNIPFNLRGDYPGNLYDVSFTNGNILCVLHCLRAIKVGGSACIIVPENLCYDPAYAEGRKEILKQGKLSAVVRLPRATFKSYTTARTCVLCFTEVGKEETDSFRYIEIKNDGFSASTWREPVDENDIPGFLENKDDLRSYPLISLDENLTLVPDTAGMGKNYQDYWFLRDIVEAKTPTSLEANKMYNEPRLCSHTNTIRKRGDARLGRNIRQKEKIIIEPGDLVIATLHTQSGNGLFAISDDYYVATSQVVAKIKDDIVDKRYLAGILKKILPTMEANDLVGRETFKPKDILNIKIPKQPKYFYTKEYKDMVKDMVEIQSAYESKMEEELHKVFGNEGRNSE